MANLPRHRRPDTPGGGHPRAPRPRARRRCRLSLNRTKLAAISAENPSGGAGTPNHRATERNQGSGCDSHEHHLLHQGPQGLRRRSRWSPRPAFPPPPAAAATTSPPPRPPRPRPSAGPQARRLDRLADRQRHPGHARPGLRRRADHAQAHPRHRRHRQAHRRRADLPDHRRQRDRVQARPGLALRDRPDPARGLRPLADRRWHQGRADQPQRRPGRLARLRRRDRQRQGRRLQRLPVQARRPHPEAAGHRVRAPPPSRAPRSRSPRSPPRC